MELTEVLERWHLDAAALRERVYRSATARERERWHALWLLTQGWTAGQAAAALGRNPHTVGAWLARFGRDGPGGLTFTHSGGAPPP